MRGWKRFVEQHVPKLHNRVVLIGNKCDLIEKRKVSYERGKALADEFGWLFFETSAKENVTEAFMAAARIGLSGGCMPAQMHTHDNSTRLHMALTVAVAESNHAHAEANAAVVRPC